VELKYKDGLFYDNLDIRKAILLVHYTDFAKEFVENRNMEKLSKFISYFQKEMEVIGDESLDQELKILQNFQILGKEEENDPISKKRKAEEEPLLN